ncbi:MAG: preprotein translocase, SecG subunit [Dehalococcoidia bacterium]|nr:preprotein translocase, SecG subunit [Dehalococcoidia bacterium]
MESSFQIAQILVSILLVVAILLQVRGQGSGFFGSAQASFRTRRGVEKTLFQFTIILVVIFTVLSIFSAVQPSWLF